LGTKKSAKTVVRIARAGEAWMREDMSSLLKVGQKRAPKVSHFAEKKIDGEASAGDDAVEYSGLFYGEKRPKIALDRYLGRLVRYLDSFSEGDAGIESMGILSLLGAVILIDRMAGKTNFHLDPMNTHRVFMIATLVAFKTLDDEPCSNEYYANVGGVELAELNVLEATFLKALNFEASLHSTDIVKAMSEFSGAIATSTLFETWYENAVL